MSTSIIESLINKETGLSEREEYFLDVLFTEGAGDIEYSMKLSGYPPSASVAQVRRKLSKQIKQLTKDYIVAQTPRAAMELVKVFRDPAVVGTQNILKAATEILNRGDVNKEEAQYEMPENVIILLPPKKTEKEGLVIEHDCEEAETD